MFHDNNVCNIHVSQKRKYNKFVVCLPGGEIVLYFLQVAALGPLWGYIMAKITLFCLSRVFNDALIEITITLASTYMTYYIGKLLPRSNIICVIKVLIEIIVTLASTYTTYYIGKLLSGPISLYKEVIYKTNSTIYYYPVQYHFCYQLIAVYIYSELLLAPI